MAANFYDNSGMMAGCDFHTYIPAAPPPVLSGPPIPGHPHIVSVPFSWDTATFWKRTDTVKSDNCQMIQGSFDLYLVPHFPWPVPPPGLLEIPELATVIAGSGSKAQLTAHSVTGQGNALATCIFSAFGLNLNCQDLGISAPTGIVLNINSVETSPTAGDYVGAYVGMCVDNAIGFIVENVVPDFGGKELAKHFWRRIGDIPYLKVLDVPSHVQNFVQRAIDGSIGEAAEGFASDVKGAF